VQLKESWKEISIIISSSSYTQTSQSDHGGGSVNAIFGVSTAQGILHHHTAS